MERLRLDVKDAEIVKILQSDGRASWKEIAERVRLSIPAVRSRVKRLEELGVIKGYMAVVDAARILERIRAYLLLSAPPERVGELAGRLAAHAEVRELHHVAGRYNLVARVELRDMEAMRRFAESSLSKVETYEYLIITSSDKEAYGSVLNPDDSLRIRCDFCKALIVETPVIEYIGGGRYYFSSKECAEAFKERLGRRSD
ncbi:MAG: winged helix-turn-helix transcriptional regulator [Nitrososphaerota archaeon]